MEVGPQPKFDHEKGEIDSLPEDNNAVNTDNFRDELKSLEEHGVDEKKIPRMDGSKIYNSNSVECEEKTATSSNELNGIATNDQPTTENPNSNSLVAQKEEDLPRSDSDEGDIASSTLAQVIDQALHETNSQLIKPEINGIPGTESGSHRSPDKNSKEEYRKIKNEVTGEGETSESEGEANGFKDTTAEKETTANDNVDKDTWMDILGNGLLKKRVLQEGKGQDTRPDRGQVVTLQVAGRTENGTAVDWNRNLEFILGEGEVIQAFDLAVALMELDEVCELVTDPKYAYGKAGKPDGNPPIPPDAKLTYELQLLATRDGPNVANMTDEQKLIIGEKKREIGNNLYTSGDYAGAINSYQRALKYLSSSLSKEVQSLRVKCWNNMAAAQLKIKAFSAAEKSCSQVLQIDPNNVKALFRKGKVLAANGETESALVYVKKADQFDPGNKTIRGELNRLKQLLALEKQSERSMYQRMVGDLTGRNGKKDNRTIFGWPLVFGATVVALGGILMAVYLTRH